MSHSEEPINGAGRSMFLPDWTEIDRLERLDAEFIRKNGPVPKGYVLYHGVLYEIPPNPPPCGWIFIRGKFWKADLYPPDDTQPVYR